MNELMTKVIEDMSKECNFKNSSLLLLLILPFMDMETWTFDKQVMTKIYQAIDFVEKNNDLKNLFQHKVEINENSTNTP